MPEMVGNALMAAQSPSSGKQVQESYGQVDPGRGFPLSKGAADMMSVVPGFAKSSSEPTVESSDIGTMIATFDWLVHKGLYEALQIRKDMAAKATQELQQQLGPEQFRQIFRGDEITEDMVYAKKAHEALPHLANWFKSVDPKSLEPSETMIELPKGKNIHRISLDDINRVIGQLNKVQNAIKLDHFQYAGPGGFIEWIEDGPWAEPVGTQMEQPWRTKHGVSLDNAKVRRDETGQLVYQFGGIVTQMRNNDGSYQKGLRNVVKRVLSESAQAIRGKVDMDSLSPEEKDWLEQVTSAYEKGHRIDYLYGYADSKGLNQDTHFAKENIYQPGDEVSLAIDVLLIRYAIDTRVKINEILDNAGDDETARNMVMRKYGLNQKDLNSVRGKNAIRGDNKAEIYRKFGVDEKPRWATGKGVLGQGTSDLRPSSMMNVGFKFLTHLNPSIPELVHQYLGKEIEAGHFGEIEMKDVATELNDLKNNSSSGEVKFGAGRLPYDPKTMKDVPFGNKLDKEETLTSLQIRELMKPKDQGGQGYIFQPSRGEPKDISLARAGKLKSATDSITLKRTDTSEDWKALHGDGTTMKGYDTNVPLIFPSRDIRYKGGVSLQKRSAVASKASAKGMREILQDLQSRPEDYGYGIGGMPDSFSTQMYKVAERLASSAKSQAGTAVNYNAGFSGKEPKEIAGELESQVPIYFANDMELKYGGILTDPRFADEMVYKQLSNDHADLPGLKDKADIRFWINRMQQILKQGQEPEIVDEEDATAATWSQRDPREMPRKVHNAFLVAGARNRAHAAETVARRENRSGRELQQMVAQGKEGEEIQTDVEDTGKPHSDQSNDSDTMRGRLGFNKELGLTGGEEIDFKKTDGVVERPFLKSRNLMSNPTYAVAYKRTTEELDQAVPQAVAEVLNGVTNATLPSQAGRLDAASDKVYNLLKTRSKLIDKNNVSSTDMQDKILPLYKTVGLPLKSKYKMGGLDELFFQLFGKTNYSMLKAMAGESAGEPAKAAIPAAQPMQPKPQAPVPQATPTPQPQQQQQPKPQVKPAGGGLGRFIPKKNESFETFSERIRKIQETDAIYDGTKGEFNWFGAVGSPGKIIDGDVKTKKGKKRAKS